MQTLFSHRLPLPSLTGCNSYKEITPTEDWISRCTGKIHVITLDGIKMATVFHMGNGYFLTAGNTFKKHWSENSWLVLDAVSFSKFTFNLVLVSEDPDFAIIRVSDLVARHHLSLTTNLSHAYLMKKEVVIAHHPHGGKMKLSEGKLRAPPHEITHQETEHASVFNYTATTLKGSSGAAVALKDSHQVIGVDRSQEKEPPNNPAFTSIQSIHEYLLDLTNGSGILYPQGLAHFAKEMYVDNHAYINGAKLTSKQHPYCGFFSFAQLNRYNAALEALGREGDIKSSLEEFSPFSFANPEKHSVPKLVKI